MNHLINDIITALNGLGGAFCNCTGSMFVQSGVLIVLLLFVDILIRRRVRATLRYWIWMLVFVKLILPPSLSLPTGIGYWRGEILRAAPLVLEQASRVIEDEPAGPPVPGDTPLRAEAQQVQLFQTNHEPASSITAALSTLKSPTWQAIAFLLWLVGVAVFSALLIQRMLYVRRLIRRSEPAKNSFTEMLNLCREQVGAQRPIELRVSNNVSSPAVCGLFKPVILIQKALIEKLSQDKLRTVLVHELCHIRRGDLWINSAQTILQTIYFYNPLVWLANSIVRRIREQAADEMVLVALGAEAKCYSNTLIDIAEMAFTRLAMSLRLVGVVESKRALNGRIKHMITRPIPRSARVGAWGFAAISLMAAILLPMARAQDGTKQTVEMSGPESHHDSLLSENGVGSWRGVGGSVDPSLIAWWKLDDGTESGVVTDSSGNGIDGNFVGNPKWVLGKSGAALLFDGASAVSFGNPRKTAITGPLTIACWIKPQDLGTTPRVVGGSEDRAFLARDGAYAFKSSGLNLRFTTPWIRDHEATNTFLTVGRWQHVAVTFQPGQAGGCVFYLDGVESDREDASILKTGTGPIRIATDQWPGGQFYTGVIDDVRLYSRVLSENEIKRTAGGNLLAHVARPSYGEKVSSQDAIDLNWSAGDKAVPQKAPSLLPNIFIMAPSQSTFNIFDKVVSLSQDWVWNKTGRQHSKKSYDEIFDGTHNRTANDVLVIVFSLDREDRIPADYQDLLPKPWREIEAELRQGRTVELLGKARELNIILIAAPNINLLEGAITESRFLNNPKSFLKTSGRDCDVGIEEFKINFDPDRLVYYAVASIRNYGKVTSPGFIVSFCQDIPGRTKPMVQGAGPIEPGKVWNERSSFFGLKEGVNKISVVLDPANLVEELEENNNSASLSVVVKNGRIVEN